MRVSINVIQHNSFSSILCKAFANGIRAAGDEPVMRTERDMNMRGFDAALFWGFTTNCQRVKEACVGAGIPWVFMDSGYLMRESYYKVTVNDRHPHAYIMAKAMPDDRLQALKATIHSWVKGKNVVVCGMSSKAAWSHDLGFEQWERATVGLLRTLTERPIIYRPKPNSPQAKDIEGAITDRSPNVAKALASAHAVVTHSSNVGCDALFAGVPVFTRFGAALPLGYTDAQLDQIEAPRYEDDATRAQWAANLAYCQWNAREMADGSAWRHVKGLIG